MIFRKFNIKKFQFIPLSVVVILSLLAATGLCAETQTDDSTVYFVVAEPVPFHFDSYILPLSDPADIAFARQIIANGWFKIVNARIASGSNRINRNVLAPGMPEWSWHVTEFLEFADNTIELCDGCPTGIEQNPGLWDSQICFWSYTVVMEIPLSAPVEKNTWGMIRRIYSE